MTYTGHQSDSCGTITIESSVDPDLVGADCRGVDESAQSGSAFDIDVDFTNDNIDPAEIEYEVSGEHTDGTNTLLVESDTINVPGESTESVVIELDSTPLPEGDNEIEVSIIDAR